MRLSVIVLFCLYEWTIGEPINPPKVVIVGAGSSGIAAASKLFQNGFTDTTILEAESRIGGRVYTTKFDDYLVDLGGQWVHGQIGNVAYELAAPLGLLANSTEIETFTYDSSGKLVDPTIFLNIMLFYDSLYDKINASGPGLNGSLGEYMEKEFNAYFADHTEIDEILQKKLLNFFNLVQTAYEASDSWYEPAIKRYFDYEPCGGDKMVNWKTRGYSTILDILMKKIPNSDEELPILNNTLLNAHVEKIEYTDKNGPIQIRTTDGRLFEADHVIITTSLGVLKNKHKTLFDPSLPESKVTSIEGLEFGTACKMFLAFDDPWWQNDSETYCRLNFLWNDDDKTNLQNSLDEQWLPSTVGFYSVEYKPRLLEGWISAKGCRLMENLPDDLILNQTMKMLHTFVGNDYNITRPTKMIRSRWTKNTNFFGTYSFQSLKTEGMNASPEELSKPIMNGETPVLLFAGEATNKRHFSTVHGAIESGWREADRLISFYSTKDNANKKEE